MPKQEAERIREQAKGEADAILCKDGSRSERLFWDSDKQAEGYKQSGQRGRLGS